LHFLPLCSTRNTVDWSEILTLHLLCFIKKRA
jgi:hypothetical protein